MQVPIHPQIVKMSKMIKIYSVDPRILKHFATVIIWAQDMIKFYDDLCDRKEITKMKW